MATQITNYQCPACTGPLRYSGEDGMLVCDYCDSKFEVAEIEKLYAEKEQKAVEAGKKAADDEDRKAQMRNEWGEDADKMRAYICPSCGAELICDETTAATSCPYCGNPTVVPGQFAGTIRPDYVIPFKLSKEDAKAALKKHYRKNFFLPSVFSTANHIEEIKGVYVPFWLFDATADGNATFHASRSVSFRQGDYRVTETSHFNVYRSGTAQFVHIPADASSKMPNNYMDAIEPFDYSELKEFSTAYLPGFLADKYDVTAEENHERIDKRCTNTLNDMLRADVTGYMEVTPTGGFTNVNHNGTHYALLPVWLLTTKWKDKNYLFAMNGQTGKFVGELPSSKGKFWLMTGGITVAATLLAFFTGIGRALADLLF